MKLYEEIKKITLSDWIAIIVGLSSIGFVLYRLFVNKPLEADKLLSMAIFGIGLLLPGFVVLKQKQEKIWTDLFKQIDEIKRSNQFRKKIYEHINNIEISSKKQEELLENRLECINKIGALNFHFRQDDKLTLVKEKLQNASSAWFCGYSLDRLVNESENNLHDCLKNKCEVKFLLVRPGPGGEPNELMKQHTKFRPIHQVQLTVNMLARIKENLIQEGFNPKLKIKYTDWIPSCALYIINHEQGADDTMQVEIYPPCFDTTAGVRPVFMLNKNKNSEKDWYEYFCKQFNSLWRQGTEVEI